MGILTRLLGDGDQTVAAARRPQTLAANGGRPALEGSTGWAADQVLAHPDLASRIADPPDEPRRWGWLTHLMR